MRPAECITALNQQLAAKGETVTLRRRIGTTSTFVEVAVRARLSGYRAEQLVGTVKQTDSSFVLSPTEIEAASATWPGAAGAARCPRSGISSGVPAGRIGRSKPCSLCASAT